jgi:hypothetical protein
MAGKDGTKSFQKSYRTDGQDWRKWPACLEAEQALEEKTRQVRKPG